MRNAGDLPLAPESGPGAKSEGALGLLSPHYKWVALSNTTIGVLMASMNSSIVLIALPD